MRAGEPTLLAVELRLFCITVVGALGLCLGWITQTHDKNGEREGGQAGCLFKRADQSRPASAGLPCSAGSAGTSRAPARLYFGRRKCARRREKAIRVRQGRRVRMRSRRPAGADTGLSRAPEHRRMRRFGVSRSGTLCAVAAIRSAPRGEGPCPGSRRLRGPPSPDGGAAALIGTSSLETELAGRFGKSCCSVRGTDPSSLRPRPRLRAVRSRC